MKRRLAIHVFASISAVFVAAPAWAEAFERTFEDYVLRGSTVSSDNLSEETAKAHGILRSPRQAVINVTVSRKNDAKGGTLPAEVAVRTIDPGGDGRDIEMRKTDVNGYVSYSGVYALIGREGIELEVKAQPKGSNKTLTMRFRDQVRVIGNDLN